MDRWVRLRGDGTGDGIGVATGDEGLTLLEVLVAIAIVGIVMASLTSFFVTSLSSLNLQSNRQSAVHVADSAMEVARALKATSVLSGRDKTSSDAQWAAPVTGVSGYLADMQETWDDSASAGAGSSATLPTTVKTVTVNSVGYGENFYVGQCWQDASGGTCGASNVSGYVGFLRVVVAVTWNCAATTCSYVTSTLVNTATDPVFNSNDAAQAPKVDTATAQTSDVATATSVQFTASGGAPALTWSAGGLPPGLSMNSSGLVSGTPTTVGTYSATVTVTDARQLVGTAGVTWTVNAAPTVTSPGNQSTSVSTAVSLTVAAGGGSSPYTWSATGLPAGLTISPSSGAITGTPGTTSPPATVTVTATDSAGAAASASFTWTVVPGVTTPAAQAGQVGVAVAAVQVTASGGASAYWYTASGLPTGLSIAASTGKITGTPTVAGTYTATVTVTDGNGASAGTGGFTWTVASPGVTAPTTTSTALGTAVNVQATASGGVAPLQWTATNLPTGLSISSSGLITGTPSQGTRFLATVTVTDANGQAGSVTFAWSVTTASALRVTAPTTDRTDSLYTKPSVSVTSSGGSGIKTWTATGLPTGISMSSGGVVSGTLTVRGSYKVKLTVTDSANAKAIFMFVWTVT